MSWAVVSGGRGSIGRPVAEHLVRLAQQVPAGELVRVEADRPLQQLRRGTRLLPLQVEPRRLFLVTREVAGMSGRIAAEQVVVG